MASPGNQHCANCIGTPSLLAPWHGSPRRLIQGGVLIVRTRSATAAQKSRVKSVADEFRSHVVITCHVAFGTGADINRSCDAPVIQCDAFSPRSHTLMAVILSNINFFH